MMSLLAKIIVDERERSSGIPQLLARLGDHIVYKILDVGDYIVGESIAIERKRVPDFIRSIFDGRIFDQVGRLLDVYDKVVLLVQGSPGEVKMTTDRWSSFYGTIARMILEDGVSIVYTHDIEDTAYLIHSLAQKSQSPGIGGGRPLIHKKPKLGTVDEWQVYIVQSLPYIGPKLARKLLERFGSVLSVFNASALELSRVEGISEWKAQEIVRILRSPYNKGLFRSKERDLGSEPHGSDNISPDHGNANH